VEIKDDPYFWLYGDSRRLLDIDIWPPLSTSPILTHFSWSPPITAALAIHPALSSATPSFFVPSTTFFQPTSLSGLLALYIQQGDYTDHCTKLEVFTNFGNKMFTALVTLRETFIWSIVMGRERRASGLSIEVV